MKINLFSLRYFSSFQYSFSVQSLHALTVPFIATVQVIALLAPQSSVRSQLDVFYVPIRFQREVECYLSELRTQLVCLESLLRLSQPALNTP